MANDQSADIPAFLAQGGSIGRLIARRDWSQTPLGPIAGWPQSLKAMLGFLLRSPVPMVMLWGEEGIMLYNDAYSVFAGGRHPDLLGSKVREGWAEIADFNDNVMRVGLAGGTLAYRDQELTLIRHGHPEQVWMDLDYSPVLDDSGHPAGVLAIVIETTERVRSAALRRESDQRLGAALAIARLGAFEWDIRTGDLILDARARAIFGFPARGRLTIADVKARIRPEDQARVEEQVRSGRDALGRIETEYCITMPDGSSRWVLSISDTFAGPDGEPDRIVGIFQDATERRLAESQLRASEARARAERDRAQNYLQVAEIMLLALDSTGAIETINRKGAEILGYDDPGALIGRDWFDLAVSPQHRAKRRAMFARIVAGELADFAAFEGPICRSDGAERRIEWRSSVMRDERGRITGTLSSGDDVTEQREAEARERLLVQEVDHRAKNLLAVVQSVVQLTWGEDVPAFKESVTGRIQSLARTHGLLAAARWEGADLKQIVTEELAPYTRGEDALAHISGPALHLTPAAAQALALVVHELATNAAKYGALSVPGGCIEVEWSGDAETISLEWRERGGPPVAPPSRHGFGTTVLQTSVGRQMRGQVALDWRQEGLCCTLTLPAPHVRAHARRAPGAAGSIGAPPPAPPGHGNGRTILVLEDEALIATQLEELLASAGYMVVGPAGHVTEAFDLFYSARPHAALLDINLAGDRSFPLAELLRAKGVPFALCTGYGESAMVPESLRDAPTIVKPFTSDDLLRIVGQLCA